MHMHSLLNMSQAELQRISIFNHCNIYSNKDKFIIKNALQTDCMQNHQVKQRKIALFENIHCFSRKTASPVCYISDMFFVIYIFLQKAFYVAIDSDAGIAVAFKNVVLHLLQAICLQNVFCK